MEAKIAAAAAPGRVNGQLIAGAVAVVLAAIVLVFAVTAGTQVSPTATAGNTGLLTELVEVEDNATPGEVVDEAEADVDAAAGQSTQQVVAAGAAIAAQAEATAVQAEATAGEVIADDDTPLSAYPMAVANPLDGITWLLLAGIVGASVFFLLATRRLNRDITHMKTSLR